MHYSVCTFIFLIFLCRHSNTLKACFFVFPKFEVQSFKSFFSHMQLKDTWVWPPSVIICTERYTGSACAVWLCETLSLSRNHVASFCKTGRPVHEEGSLSTCTHLSDHRKPEDEAQCANTSPEDKRPLFAAQAVRELVNEWCHDCLHSRELPKTHHMSENWARHITHQRTVQNMSEVRKLCKAH